MATAGGVAHATPPYQVIRSGGVLPAPSPPATVPVVNVGSILRICPLYTVPQCQTFTSWEPSSNACQERRRVACLDLLKGETSRMTGDKRPMYVAGNDVDDIHDPTRTDLASKSGFYGAYDVGNVRVIDSASAETDGARPQTFFDVEVDRRSGEARASFDSREP